MFFAISIWDNVAKMTDVMQIVISKARMILRLCWIKTRNQTKVTKIYFVTFGQDIFIFVVGKLCVHCIIEQKFMKKYSVCI